MSPMLLAFLTAAARHSPDLVSCSCRRALSVGITNGTQRTSTSTVVTLNPLRGS